MGRIRVVQEGGTYHVTVEGRLVASDLRRLERACGHALKYQTIPLVLRLEGVTIMDDPARAYLERLRLRGAVIQNGPDRTTALLKN